MIVFVNTLKRLIKSKVQIGVLFLLPLLPLIPICLGNNSSSMGTIKVAIIDKDRTELTSAFKECLGTRLKIINIEEKDIEQNINEAKVNFVISIPKGYTNGIINLENVDMQGYVNKDKDKDITPIMKEITDGFIDPVKKIAKVSNKNSNIFYGGFKSFKESFIEEFAKTDEKSGGKNSAVAWGMIIQFTLFSSIFASNLIITDKEKKTFFRSLSSPLPLRNYMFQTVLAFFCLSLLQVTVLSLVVVFGFGIETGISIVNMLVLLYALSLVSVAFGIAVSSLSKNTTQSASVGIGVVTLMSMLGGAWGMKPTAKLLESGSKLIPVTWAMDGVQRLINKETLSGIMQDIGVLAVFAVVFFLLGTWRKNEVVS